MAEKNEISVLVMAIERLSEGQAQTNEKVDKLIESMGKQEVILEKLANIEKSHAESQKRVHKRRDAIEEDVKDIRKHHVTGCTALNSFIARREVELKGYDHTIAEMESKIGANSKLLKEMKDIPNKIMLRVLMVAVSAVTAGLVGMFFIDKG